MFKYNEEIAFWLEINISLWKTSLILKTAKQKISNLLEM